MSKLEIKVPSLGESISEATISKWLKNEGDKVEKDEVVLELETDKVTQEIYAASSGVLSKVFHAEGDDVKIGDVLANIETTTLKETNSNIKKEFNKSQNSEINIVVPTLGESINEAVISKWIKKEKMIVEKGEPIVEIETDKVTQELFAEKSGLIKKILFEEQEEVKIGQTIGIIDVQNVEEKFDEKHFKNSIKKNDKAKESINNKNTTFQEIDPTNVKRSGMNNTININDLIEFAGETTLTPSGRKYINENELDLSDLQDSSKT